jgi:hypothetical protein
LTPKPSHECTSVTRTATRTCSSCPRTEAHDTRTCPFRIDTVCTDADDDDDTVDAAAAADANAASKKSDTAEGGLIFVGFSSMRLSAVGSTQ